MHVESFAKFKVKPAQVSPTDLMNWENTTVAPCHSPFSLSNAPLGTVNCIPELEEENYPKIFKM